MNGPGQAPSGHKLCELAPAYRDAAVRIRVGLNEEVARAGMLEGGALVQSKERIRILRGMLQDMRDLRQLTEGYYMRPRDQELAMVKIHVVMRHE